MSTAKANHPYHLVDPSPWPLVGSLAAGLLTFGIVFYIHYDTSWMMIAGLVGVLATMFFWWKDVVKESTILKQHTPVVEIGMRFGMALFIASEVMFFAAFFWAFFDASLFPKEATGFQWPPEGIKTFDPLDLPFLNTIILLTSGTTVTWAHHAVLEGNRKATVQALALTVFLGATFTALQVVEYAEAPFSIKDGIYPSTFFLATGFHGFHVIIGTIFLFVCMLRAWKGHFTPERHFGLEAAAWYWHFVDVVWLFLYICVYWWGS